MENSILNINKGRVAMVKKELLNYEIIIKDQIDHKWLSHFNGFSLNYVNGKTIIRGNMADQAALIRLINNLHGLGFSILVFRRIIKKTTS
jgi:hypothetical protein